MALSVRTNVNDPCCVELVYLHADGSEEILQASTFTGTDAELGAKAKVGRISDALAEAATASKEQFEALPWEQVGEDKVACVIAGETQVPFNEVATWISDHVKLCEALGVHVTEDGDLFVLANGQKLTLDEAHVKLNSTGEEAGPDTDAASTEG